MAITATPRTEEDGQSSRAMTVLRKSRPAPVRVAISLAVFLAKRILRVLAVLVTTTFAVYLLVLGTRDPVAAMLGEFATPDQRIALREKLGLDQPIILQYWDWVTHGITGDLGRSIRTGQRVGELLAERAMPTIQLALYALLISVVLGMIMGVLAARWRGSWGDGIIGLVSLAGIALPNFALALLLVLLFAVALGWLPMSGYVPFGVDPAMHLTLMIMPALALAGEMLAIVTRLTRSASSEAIDSPFVAAARGRGIRESVVMRRYVARSAAVPVMTFIGLRMGYLLGGAVVVETVFQIPGIGSLAAMSVFQADYPVVLGVVLVSGIVVALSNIIVDLLYRVVDPRAR